MRGFMCKGLMPLQTLCPADARTTYVRLAPLNPLLSHPRTSLMILTLSSGLLVSLLCSSMPRIAASHVTRSCTCRSSERQILRRETSS
jgi:hypothetical protein